MVLIVGGLGQGKRAYAESAYHLTPAEIADGASCPFSIPKGTKAIDRLHLLVRRLVQTGADPLAWARDCVSAHPELIFLSDEIGCGVVPLTPEERTWREAAGRVCCHLAGKASQVVRLCCGLPAILKGTETEEPPCS